MEGLLIAEVRDSQVTWDAFANDWQGQTGTETLALNGHYALFQEEISVAGAGGWYGMALAFLQSLDANFKIIEDSVQQLLGPDEVGEGVVY